MSSVRKTSTLLFLAVALVLLLPGQAHAYIGPGAGFALAGSFFAVFAAIGSALLTFITWPIRLLKRTIFGWRAFRRSRFKRVVILGLDGMDHGLTETMLEEGKLPHLATLREQGCFKPLGTTVPPLSPVAWSTFQTGVNPGKHNIFDFLTPDTHTYCAKLSSVSIRPPRGRSGWASTGFRSARLISGCCARASHSGPSSPSTASSVASSTCRSRSLRSGSGACCSRRCASPTCAERRGCSRTTRPGSATKVKRSAARSTTLPVMARPFAPT